MGKVTIDFVGLFLFDNRYRDRKRIAVIDGSRSDKSHHGIHLRPHAPFILVEGNADTDWPHRGDRYELKGEISFTASGGVDDREWALPKIASGCSGFSIEPEFFDEPRADATHAIVDLQGGDLCSWRFNIDRAAFNSRVVIETNGAFSMLRSDGRRIDFDPAVSDAKIWFQNTELADAPDDNDWLWYYVASGNGCFVLPDATGIIPPRKCSPPDQRKPHPYTLGCSNSQWP